MCSGLATYTSQISVPATVPTFLTVKVTSHSVASRSEYSKEV